MFSLEKKGKSLSLICAALTWLRAHKRNRYEASFEAVSAGMRGEPEWMVEAALRRKRDELGRAWEERERALERVRAKEREMERESLAREAGGRRKRARVDGGDGGHDDKEKKRMVNEEREFLIGDWEGSASGDGEGEDGLSRETRALMEKVGLGGMKRSNEAEGELEEEVKVGLRHPGIGEWLNLTSPDLLHFSHPFATHTVYLRVAAAGISSVNTGGSDGSRRERHRKACHRGRQAASLIIKAEAVYQPFGFAPRIAVRNQ